jgi:tetratricopeptide (TPR) repeat protein
MRKTNSPLAVSRTVCKASLQLSRCGIIVGGVLAAACAVFIPSAHADTKQTDTVHFSERGTVRQVKGTITDFNGQGMRILSPSGQERVISAENVTRIETRRTPAQRAARLAAKAGQNAKAASTYYRLLQSAAESRGWVRREILNELVLALRADGKYFQASKVFLALLGEDPGTPYFNAIPLVWTGGRTLLPQAESTAIEWLGSQRAAERFLAGSLLLGSKNAQQAERVLEALKDSKREPMASLAAAQLLRLRLPQATEKDIQACRQTINRLPLSLRGGPYYILGKLYAARGKNREAAVAAMRVPILYSEDPNLAAESLLTAGKSMIQSGLVEDGQRIYSELINTYPQSTAANDAKQRKAALNVLP